jgi:hypothetical protein
MSPFVGERGRKIERERPQLLSGGSSLLKVVISPFLDDYFVKPS